MAGKCLCVFFFIWFDCYLKVHIPIRNNCGTYTQRGFNQKAFTIKFQK